ncbi:benzoate/H(+) symporter BenE family transporter, partial [Mycobacterium tuberculosis]|nr:benzoate/H(+) symporter BenE family transporter [Mycobacterium tuberculosis]
LQASGYTVPVSALIVVCGGLALLLAPFGVYSICIAAITAAICQSPEAHPDPNQRWLAAIAAGGGPHPGERAACGARAGVHRRQYPETHGL